MEIFPNYIILELKINLQCRTTNVNYPFKDEAQFTLVKDPVRTAQ